MKLILARLAVIDQCQRHQSQLIEQILNAMQHDAQVDDLPDCIKDRLPLQSLANLNYVEEQIEDKDVFRKLVMLCRL